MKLIDMRCPYCGGNVKIPEKGKHVSCEYCGADLILDDEEQHILCDYAEEAGYKFEKGRQRARTEAKQNRRADYNSQYQYDYSQKRTKGRTWLWILGWILIFPIPLTILMLRSKKLNRPIRLLIIAAAWIFYFVICYSGNKDKELNTNQQTVFQPTPAVIAEEDDNSKEERVSEKESEALNDSSETEAEENSDTSDSGELVADQVNEVYVDDSVINQFITDFNAVNKEPITDISTGNIRTKYFGYVQNIRIEMINANNAAAKAFCISIYGGKEESDREEMFKAYSKIAKILEPALSDEVIENSINELVSRDVLAEDFRVGETLDITYVPIKELSYGKSDCRLDIKAYNYPGDGTSSIEEDDSKEVGETETEDDTTISGRRDETLKGRGRADTGRSEPHYLGVIGYVAVDSTQAYYVEKTDAFQDENLWMVPTYEKDKQFWIETGSLPHKTEVIVRKQLLEHEGWGRYSGYLLVEKTEDGSQYYINVSNYITNPYWTMQDDLWSAALMGDFVAEYKQSSDYWPVDSGGDKLEIPDGTVVLVTGVTGTSSRFDKKATDIEAIVWKEWKKGYGGVKCHFNNADLKILY